jgi:hypothetical protein
VITNDLHKDRPARAGLSPILARRSLFAGCVTALASAIVAANEVSLSKCPAPVAETIRLYLERGELDEIKRIRVGERELYLVEIDLPGGCDLKLHVAGSGKLLKSVEEIRHADLPEAVREALAGMRFGLSWIDDMDKVCVDGITRYRIEVKRPGRPKLELVFEEDGSLASGK